MRRWTILILALLALTSLNAAERIGVYVEFPNGAVYKDCVTVGRNADAYETLQQTGLATTWTESPKFGHSLCAIFDTGCKESGCVCSSRHWNLFTLKNGAWAYSEAGYDGGRSCREHYCAHEGDVIGLNFNSDGKAPKNATYADLCPPQPKETVQPDVIGNVIAFPAKNAGYLSAGLVIILLIGYFVYKPWQYI
jgi:hypothetical protein